MGRIIMVMTFLVLMAAPAVVRAEGIAVIINENNPTRELSIADLGRIYRGRTTAWSDGKSIVAVNRDSSSGVREDFYGKVLDSKPTEKFFLPGSPVPFRTLVQRSAEAVIRYVAGEGRAIGYVYLSELNGKAEGVKVILTIK